MDRFFVEIRDWVLFRWLNLYIQIWITVTWLPVVVFKNAREYVGLGHWWMEFSARILSWQKIGKWDRFQVDERWVRICISRWAYTLLQLVKTRLDTFTIHPRKLQSLFKSGKVIWNFILRCWPPNDSELELLEITKLKSKFVGARIVLEFTAFISGARFRRTSVSGLSLTPFNDWPWPPWGSIDIFYLILSEPIFGSAT